MSTNATTRPRSPSQASALRQVLQRAYPKNVTTAAASAATHKRFQRSDEAVGPLADRVRRTRANRHIPIDAGAAAQAEVGRTIGQINLLHIRTGREVLHALDDLDHASAALAQATAVIEIAEPFVGVDSGIQGRLAQVCPFDASDLLAFLFKSDGGHGRSGCEGAAQLRPIRCRMPSICPSCFDPVASSESPLPNLGEITNASRGSGSSRYDLVVQQLIPGYASLARLSVALLAVSPRACHHGAEVLVAGCGTGAELVEARSQRPDWRITAIDPAAAMLTAAQARLGKDASPSIHWQQARVEDLQAEGRFAGALSVLVLQSLADDGTKLRFLTALARSLEPAGQLVLVDRMAAERSALQNQVDQALLAFQRASGLSDPDGQLEELTEATHPIGRSRLTALVNAAGFGDPAPIFQALGYEGFLLQRLA